MKDGGTGRTRKEIHLEPGRWDSLFDPPEEASAIEAAPDVDACIAEALEHVPARQREIYQLFNDEELTHQQIASRLGITKCGPKAGLSKAK